MKYDFYSLYPPADIRLPFIHTTHTHTTDAPEDVCFGVAEMKFKVLPEITELLSKAAANGFLGYIDITDEFYETVKAWHKARHNWEVQREWFRPVSGVVPSIGAAIRAFTNPGDGVIVQLPIYPPFISQVERNGRKVVENRLILKEGHWEIDFNRLEADAARPDVTAIVLCSPHNPTGRVWTREELTQIADIAKRNHLFVICDEIHSDLIMPGYTHTVFSQAANGVRHVVLNAPSKTFSIPGLSCALAFVPDEDDRKLLFPSMHREMGGYHNIMGILACGAGYRWGGAWLDECCSVIAENDRILRSALAEYFPEVQMARAEGTYLRWADFSCLGKTPKELEELFNKAHFYAEPGQEFDPQLPAFIRINIACPGQYITPAVCRLHDAL